ncbi:hypothetical protein [Muricoccus pecuniae]|uniref:Uncharacterized protein n=1 Tax=Muricoccus pecuniae TaxID=693023 RepID=A0A840YHE7_9PROT|nr:hypothetical protein [Roseomonas pecuniae]MBB5695801.1 hypothetical protein [Roseomonas pecuniae]
MNVADAAYRAMVPRLQLARPDALPSAPATPAAVPAAAARVSFSARELGGILAALAPLQQDGVDLEAMASDVLSNLAKRRNRGEETVLVVARSPVGGTVLMMSPGELAARLASDEPGGMGSVTTDDGRTYGFRDLVPSALRSLAAGGNTSPAERIVGFLADLMTEALDGRRADGAKAPGLPRGGGGGLPDGASVGTVALPARPPNGLGASLLDVTA